MCDDLSDANNVGRRHQVLHLVRSCSSMLTGFLHPECTFTSCQFIFSWIVAVDRPQKLYGWFFSLCWFLVGKGKGKQKPEIRQQFKFPSRALKHINGQIWPNSDSKRTPVVFSLMNSDNFKACICWISKQCSGLTLIKTEKIDGGMTRICNRVK